MVSASSGQLVSGGTSKGGTAQELLVPKASVPEVSALLDETKILTGIFKVPIALVQPKAIAPRLVLVLMEDSHDVLANLDDVITLVRSVAR
jgi:hypothetical protein